MKQLEQKKQWDKRLGQWGRILFLVMAIASCISEPLCRNCFRILLLFSVLRAWLAPNSWQPLRNCKSIWFAMTILVMLLIASSLYGGTLNWQGIIKDGLVHSLQYMLLAPMTVIFFYGRHSARNLFLLMALSLLAVDFYIYWQAWNHIPRPISWIRYSFAATAMFYLLLLPFLLLFSFSPSKSWRTAFAAMTVLGCLALLLTGTRAAWIALLPVMTGLMIHKLRNWKKIFCSLGISFLCLGCVFYASPNLTQRLSTLSDINFVSNFDRLLVWDSAWRMFQDHPATGVGLGNFKSEYQKGYENAAIREDMQHSHSNYLQLLCETGILGLSGYLWLNACILAWCWRHRANLYVMGLFAATITLLLYSTTEYSLATFSGMRLFWCLLGTAIVCCELETSPHQ